MCIHFETENSSIAKGKKIRPRKTFDRYEIHLDGTVARKPTDYLVSLVQRFKPRKEHGSGCTATIVSTWHPRLGHVNPRVVNAAKKIEGVGVQLTGRVESDETCLVNKSKQLPHPKKTEHNVSQSSELVNDQHTKHLAVYLSGTKNGLMRVFRDLAVTDGRRTQRLSTGSGSEHTSQEHRACNESGFTGIWLPEQQHSNSKETETTTTNVEQTSWVTRSRLVQDTAEAPLHVWNG